MNAIDPFSNALGDQIAAEFALVPVPNELPVGHPLAARDYKPSQSEEWFERWEALFAAERRAFRKARAAQTPQATSAWERASRRLSRHEGGGQ